MYITHSLPNLLFYLFKKHGFGIVQKRTGCFFCLSPVPFTTAFKLIEGKIGVFVKLNPVMFLVSELLPWLYLAKTIIVLVLSHHTPFY